MFWKLPISAVLAIHNGMVRWHPKPANGLGVPLHRHFNRAPQRFAFHVDEDDPARGQNFSDGEQSGEQRDHVTPETQHACGFYSLVRSPPGTGFVAVKMVEAILRRVEDKRAVLKIAVTRPMTLTQPTTPVVTY